MKKILILALVAIVGLTATAQTSKTANETQTVMIQTNGVCKHCEDLFKEKVPFFKGVKDYSYDAKTSKMTITYDAKKTSPEVLRAQISKLGYDADGVKADAAAREKLPACCKTSKKSDGHQGCPNQHKCSGHH
ncbi:MAG: heavy-metal-associated domain-containing protein [Flavobacterium sp.]